MKRTPVFQSSLLSIKGSMMLKLNVSTHWKDNKHFCETCDRGFKNEAILAEHIKEHQVCGLDGCQFKAYPKVIEKHIKMQHETGLYYRISNLYKPEDIAKWIAERKRNYPTKENVDRKQAAFEEKMKRGERLSEDKSRFQRKSLSSTPGVRRGSAHRGKHVGNLIDRRHSKKFSKAKNGLNYSRHNAEVKIEEECSRWKLLPFCGTAALQQINCLEAAAAEGGQDHCFSDSEWESTVNEVEPKSMNADVQIPVASQVLSSLMSIYASDMSDSEGDEKKDAGVQAELSTSVIPKDQNLCGANNVTQDSFCADSFPSTSNAVESKHEDNSDSAPEEVPIVRCKNTEAQPDNFQEESKPVTKQQSNRQKRKRHHNHKQHHQGDSLAKKQLTGQTQCRNSNKKINPRPRKQTLLEKLLMQEIRHERNVILQCIRHVVQNNFFEIKMPDAEINSKCMTLLKCIHHILQNEFFGTLKKEPPAISESGLIP